MSQLKINTAGIVYNYKLAKKFHNNQHVYAVIKSNAYGHGLLEIANTLRKADGLAVAHIEEAIALRNNNSKIPIVLMHGVLQEDEWAIIDEFRLDCVIHSQWQFEWMEKHQFKKKPRLWLKSNTGMNRLGLDSKSIVTIFKKTADFPRLIMNHYACADDPENPMNHNQANKIKAIEKQCDYPLTSFANSATVIANKNPLGDIARVGIMLFGHNPIRNHVQLANVSTFEAPVIAIQTIEKNDRVGYGSLWKNDEKGYLAIIRAGYADGYPQTMPSGTPVFCKNKKHFIAGRTSMDLIAIYLGQNQTNVDVGDMVELWGENIHIDEAADAANTSAYELFTRISPRVQRVYYS